MVKNKFKFKQYAMKFSELTQYFKLHECESKGLEANGWQRQYSAMSKDDNTTYCNKVARDEGFEMETKVSL